MTGSSCGSGRLRYVRACRAGAARVRRRAPAPALRGRCRRSPSPAGTQLALLRAGRGAGTAAAAAPGLRRAGVAGRPAGAGAARDGAHARAQPRHRRRRQRCGHDSGARARPRPLQARAPRVRPARIPGALACAPALAQAVPTPDSSGVAASSRRRAAGAVRTCHGCPGAPAPPTRACAHGPARAAGSRAPGLPGPCPGRPRPHADRAGRARRQAADIGVGIMGKEGRQAVNNSDFAISQFRCGAPPRAWRRLRSAPAPPCAARLTGRAGAGS
jgi:hypothetical protein